MTDRRGPDDRYALLPGIGVLRRPDGDLQIGTEPPRWVVLRHPPPRAESMLTALDGSAGLETVCRRTGSDPALWTDLVAELCRQGLAEVVDSPFPVRPAVHGPEAERISATLRWGTHRAGRALGARGDAAVVLVGTGGTHRRLAAMLTEVGVGRVEERQAPAVPHPRADRRGCWWQLDDPELGPRHPDLVVVTDQMLPPWAAADLHHAAINQLAVRTGSWGSTVGPLTLPGRTACPRCVTRHRSVADEGWPLIEIGHWHSRSPSSPLTEAMTTSLVAAEVLDLLDGTTPPATVGGTLDWELGTHAPRRRSWSVRPDCECHSATVALSP